jgi:ubiquinone/menaquinone biosynthesis C-methylase UbiE
VARLVRVPRQEDEMAADAQPHAPSLSEDSDQLARDYEEVSRNRQFQSGQRLVAALAIAPGERVLDVGCGTGLLAEHIADIVGPGGHVLGIDPLSLRVELAQAKSRPNLEFRVGNAADLSSIADSSVDVVCLNAVFHWLPEKTGPLREFARVLRAGGRLGIGGSAKEQRSPLRGVMRRVLAQPPFAEYPRPVGELSTRVDADEMRTLLERAGFEVASIDLYDSLFAHASAEAVVRFSEASSFGNLLGHLPRALRPAARLAVVEALAPLAAADGSIVQDGRRMITVARKPAR